MLRDAGPAVSGSPSGTADWIEVRPAQPQGRALWALPDAGYDATAGGPGAGSVRYVVGAPSLAVAPATGAPLFGLTLVLGRQPRADEESLIPLVSGGVIAMTATVTPTAAELRAVERADAGGSLGGAPAEGVPLFSRATHWALRHGAGGPALAEAAVDGVGGTAALTATIAADETLAVLGALGGGGVELVLSCEVIFRASGRPLPALRVSVNLAAAYDSLKASAGEAGTIAGVDIPSALARLIRDGSVAVQNGDGAATADGSTADPAILASALRDSLLRALLPVLVRSTGAGPGASDSYRPTARPSGATRISFVQRSMGGDLERRILLERPLRDALRELADGHPLDAFVRPVCVGEGGAFQPVVHLLPATRGRPPADQAPGLAAIGKSAAALPAVLRTSVTARIDAAPLAVSDIAIRPQGSGGRWVLTDLVVDLVGDRPQHLPQIDGDDPLWPDRADASHFFYAPEFTVAVPDPSAADASSRFLFSFRTVGHDAQGRPGLEATIRLALRQGMAAATAQAWEARGRPVADPVPANGLAVALEIPFRTDQGDGSVQTIRAVGIEPLADGVAATFTLTDQWARAAYGALGTPGFQAQPARLIVSYVFPAYVPLGGGGTRISWGGKIAAINQAQVEALVKRDAEAWAEQPDGATGGRGPTPGARDPRQRATLGLVSNGLMLHPVGTLALHAILVQPDPVRRSYGIQTQGRSTEQDVLFPCSTYGALYVQTGNPATSDSQGTVAIGCRDAWTLGQVQLRLYEPVSIDLGAGDPGLTVLRSLQVPGRFLVLPRAYTITRFEPADTRAYRPAVYLFSSVDAVHPERSSCVVMATLRPAISPAIRQNLLDTLRANVHPNPSLEWPTELAVDPGYRFAIAAGGGATAQVQSAVAKTPEGFQVSLATGIDGILQLKAILEMGGVTAAVTFPLADGTTLASTLVLDLGRIDGPWETGAVSASLKSGRATITNVVERAADVSDLLVYAKGVRTGKVPVERRLEAGATATVAVPDGTTSALARYALVSGPATLDEVRTFIEDINTAIVFATSLDFAARQLSRLTIEARMIGLVGTKSAVLDAGTTSAEVGFVLPVTTYLAQPTLQYRLTATATDGTSTARPWRDWRIDTLGNLIELDQAALQEG